MNKHRGRDAGFTMVELVMVVVLLSILVLLAVPVFISARANAQKRTCFMNQNTLQRATELYLAVNPSNKREDLAGLVNNLHPIVVTHIVGRPPRCPAGDAPGDQGNPTVGEGAYTFDADGNIEPCTLGALGPHGAFDD